jgi:hypothetical protein
LTFQFVIAMIASAINERTRRKLDYALEENRILKEVFREEDGEHRSCARRPPAHLCAHLWPSQYH